MRWVTLSIPCCTTMIEGIMSRYLPDGYVDYATYNIKEVLQFLQQLLGIISESW
jgi:hypothetical protein